MPSNQERQRPNWKRKNNGGDNRSTTKSDQTNSVPNNENVNNSNANNTNNRNDRKPRTVCPPCAICGETNHSTDNCFFLEPTQQIDRLLGIEDPRDRFKINDETHRTMQMELSRLRPIFKTKDAKLSLRNCTWQTVDHQTTKLPTIPEFVRQQLREISTNHHKLDNIFNGYTNKTTQETQELENMQLFIVASQTWPAKGLQPQKMLTTTEQCRENETGNGPVPFLNSSDSCPIHVQETNKHIMTVLNGNNKIPPLGITTQYIDDTCGERRTDRWNVAPAILHGKHEMQNRNAVCASGFRERRNDKRSSRMRSLCQCRCPEWIGQNRTTNLGQQVQNERSS